MFHSETTTLRVGRWTLTGTSTGGTHTTIVVNELKICFDIGILTNASTHCDKVLISHGHVDHCQSFFKHYRCRKLKKMLPAPVYIIPPIMEKPMRDSARAQFNMEKGCIDIPSPKDFLQIVTLTGDSTYEFNRCLHSTCYITSYPMTHRIPASGYTVISEVPKLKEDYLGRPGTEIKELQEANADIFYIKRAIEIAYTGDTTITGVLRQPDMLNAEVLIIECTILDYQVSREDTHKRGHIHIQDIADNWRAFDNKHIVLFHMSPRYSGNIAYTLVREALKELPEEFRSKVQLLWPSA